MRCRRGFTLVELLVAIGIIVVLLAILLPSLKHARDSARSVRCASNVRAIVSAMMQYAQDNLEALPAPADKPDVWTANGTNNFKAYLFQSAGSLDLDYVHGAIMHYLGDLSVRQQMMVCPNRADSEPANYSYVVNDELAWDRSGKPGPGRLGRLIKPAGRIMIFEDDAPNDGHFILGASDDLPSIHHFRQGQTGNGNYGFGDAHVESLSRQTLLAHLEYAELWK
ncbi:MAG TPA: type II secretion system protein [Tepidisphaeraceae bacterium]|nr:type II secretion system protein [Tepidisphaeraceae bacterium]